METKLTFLLQELKDNFSEDLLLEIVETIKDTTTSEIVEGSDKLRKLFSGQSEKFYIELAKDIVMDMDEAPEMLLVAWEPLFNVLDTTTLITILSKCIEIATEPDAINFLTGLFEYYNDNIEIALFYFNEVESYVACYYISFCYLYQNNYENSIKNNTFFLECLNERFERVAKDGVDLRLACDVVLWNVYLDLGYAYSRTEEYAKAAKYFEKGFEILDIDNTCEIKGPFADELDDEFQPLVNCYLKALQKNGDYNKCIEVLKFVHSRYPNEGFYYTLMKELKAKAVNTTFADNVLEKFAKPYQTIKIGKYEESKILAKEKALEDMIIEQIKYGFKVFNRFLDVYENDQVYGRQYYIPSVRGFLDLLLIDKLDNQLYVVELKRNEAGIEVVDQIERYMKGLSIQFDKNVKGIICLHKPDGALTEAVKNKEDIELYTYCFEFYEVK